MEKEEIIEAVRDYLDGESYHYDYDAERELFKLGFNLKSKVRETKVFIDIKKHGYLVLAVVPFNADKDNLNGILRYTAMANYGLINGNFEVDVRDGEIRYKTWTGTEDLDSLSKVIIEDSIHIPCSMIDRYGNGLAALVFADADPDAEIKKVEGE